jgi:predicted RNase H-like nuclease
MEEAMIAVGVDGCHGGWLAARFEGGALKHVRLFSTAHDLWSTWRDADLVLVDMPIGLRDGGSERGCDLEARRVLGSPRGTSVFPVPCRPALAAESYEEACALNERHTGRRLSRQTWAIVPKIVELDRLLALEPDARDRVREGHPEICYWSFTGSPMRRPKKLPDGSAERVEALARVMPSAREVVLLVTERFAGDRVGKDDIVDTLALAITAARAPLGLLTLPPEPEADAIGLPMEIVYAQPAVEAETP